MKRRRLAVQVSVIAISLLARLDLRLHAAVPDQFQAWGTAGPQFPPTPIGWREEGPPREGLPMLQATPEEQGKGCVAFARDPFSEVEADSPPARGERATELRAFATPGEYEPITLALHALEDLDRVRVGLGRLQTADGSAIPADHVDVRLVRTVRVPMSVAAKTFHWRPFLLERREGFSLAKGTTALIWLTIKSPDTAAPGDYRGKITVQPEGEEATTVDLQLTVLPFSLPPAPVEMGIYYPRPAGSDGLLVKELIDLREHGLSPPLPALAVQVESRDRVFGDDDVASTRAHAERLLRAERITFGPWRFPVTFEVGHQITHAWDSTKNWFTYWPHQPETEADLAKAIQIAAEAANAQSVTSLRAYLIDEAGAHNLLDEAVYYNRLVKERFPGLETSTTVGGGIALGHDEIGQLSAVVDFLSANRFTPEVARALSERRESFGLYNGSGSTPAGARFFFGFHGWKSGASQIAQWCYSFGEAVFGGNGLRQEDEGYVYHAADGPLPSLMWEAVREGVDDYRYVHLLWRRIEAARSSERPEARSAAGEAERVLRSILGQIGWGFQAMQSSDRTLPPHPSTLRKLRWQMARQILKLSAFAPAAASTPVGPRPGPLDLPWLKTSIEPVQLGPEILPPSDFESGLKPWRVEAWNGQGRGQSVSDEKHGGRQSVRIEVPVAGGNSAVTVLVWSQYGDGKLDLTLEGGHTYEMSAWVKWKDRGVPPDLRVNIPSTAIALSSTGHDPAALDGWQRLWTRVEMNAHAQPTYLAVWVQGPGTVWVDDLSLREVIPPPLVLTLDQREYDTMDKVAVGIFTVAKRLQPAQLRISLISSNRGVLDALTVPFTPPLAGDSDTGLLALATTTDPERFRFVLNPSKLAPGSYACRVALLNTESQLMAEQSAQFENTTDGN